MNLAKTPVLDSYIREEDKVRDRNRHIVYVRALDSRARDRYVAYVHALDSRPCRVLDQIKKRLKAKESEGFEEEMRDALHSLRSKFESSEGVRAFMRVHACACHQLRD